MTSNPPRDSIPPGARELRARPGRVSSFLRSPRGTALALFLLCLLVYNSNGQLIATSDAVPARLIPFSILLDGTVTLDRFLARKVGGASSLERERRAGRLSYYYLEPRHGRLYSAYPITLPVLITPLYAPVVWAKGQWSTDEVIGFAYVAEKFTSALIAALSVAAMYGLLTALTDRRLALVLTLAFAFGTTTWTTSSQALWQHGPGVLFMVLALGVLARRPRRRWLAGLCAGMAVAIRPGNLFFFIALLAADLWMHRSLRRTAALVLPAIPVGAAVAAYNWVVFDNLLGGYGRVDDAFAGAFGEGLAGVLVSPSRGLFVYSPVLLAGFAGVYVAWRRGLLRREPVYATAALFLASQLVFFAWWDAWWGGWSYGPRLLTEASAMLVVLSVPAAERLRSRPWARAAFAILLAYSVGVQAAGALAFSPTVWNAEPVSVDERPERLWEWRDSQIPRTVGVLLRGEWVAGCRNPVEFLTDRCAGSRRPPSPGGSSGSGPSPAARPQSGRDVPRATDAPAPQAADSGNPGKTVPARA